MKHTLINLTGRPVVLDTKAGQVTIPAATERSAEVLTGLTKVASTDLDVPVVELQRDVILPEPQDSVLLIVSQALALSQHDRRDLCYVQTLKKANRLVRPPAPPPVTAPAALPQATSAPAPTTDAAPTDSCSCRACQNVRLGLTPEMIERVSAHAERIAPRSQWVQRNNLSAEMLSSPDKLACTIVKAAFSAMADDVVMPSSAPTAAGSPSARAAATADEEVELAAEAIQRYAADRTKTARKDILGDGVCVARLYQPAIRLLVSTGRLSQFGGGAHTWYAVPGSGAVNDNDEAEEEQAS